MTQHFRRSYFGIKTIPLVFTLTIINMWYIGYNQGIPFDDIKTYGQAAAG